KVTCISQFILSSILLSHFSLFLSLSLSLPPSLILSHPPLISKGFKPSVVHRACQCKCEMCCCPLGKRGYLFVYLYVSFSVWQPLTFCAAVNSNPDFSHFSLSPSLSP